MNKKIQYVGVLISIVASCMTLHAEEIDLKDIKETTTESLYVDTVIKLPYKDMKGVFISPLQVKGELISPFGDDRGSYLHQGIDIKVEEGTPIVASGKGIVIKAGPDSKGVDNGGGHMIFIDYGYGLEARYMHLSRYAVREGDEVQAGQVIGYTGSSGGLTTPHLHFEYRIDGQPLDPKFIFEASDMIKYSNESDEIGQNNSIQEDVDMDDFFVIQH